MIAHTLVLLGLVATSLQQFSPYCFRDLIVILNVSQRNDTKMLLDLFQPYLMLSGKSIGELGDYDACQREHQYAILTVRNPAVPLPLTFGVCISDNCTVRELNQNVDVTKDEIHKHGWDEYIPFNLNETDFFLTDPTDLPTHAGFGWFLTATLLLTLMIFSLIIPCIRLNLSIVKRPIIVERMKQINESRALLNRSSSSLRQEDYKVDASFFKHFSLTHNFIMLTDLRTSDPNLAIITGYRAISFMMVVLGHQFIILLYTDPLSVQVVLQKRFAMICVDCFFAVDSFFWIGGFFLGYVMAEKSRMREMKTKGLVSIPVIILNRLLRIWPCYILLILLMTNIAPSFGSGPLWSTLIQGLGNCNTHWWQNLLFVTIYNIPSNTCIPWAWYLDNDVQLFIVGVLGMYIYSTFNKLLAKFLILLLLIASLIAGTLITFENEFKIPYFTQFESSTQFNTYYIKPWCRGPPYFLGLLNGILYREYRQFLNLHPAKQQKLRQIPIFATFELNFFTKAVKQSDFCKLKLLIGATLMLWISFGWHSAQTVGEEFWPLWFQECYWAFSRLLFVIAMTFLAMPNLFGFCDWFNTLVMNNRMFRFVAKVGYTGYLFHFLVILMFMGNLNEQSRLTIFDGFNQYIEGTLAITVIVAAVVSLLVEIPFSNLASLVKKKRRESKVEKINIK